MITIDPAELMAAAETLRSCSIEAADIGTQLWACGQCPMPADLQVVVDQLVAVVDRSLDAVAAQLLAQSVDVTNRAMIALNDSLASTSAVVTTPPPSPSSAVESLFGGTMVFTGTNPTIGIAGFNPFEGMTIGGNSDVTTGFGGTTVIGDVNMSDISIAGFNPLAGVGIIGPGETNIGIAGYSLEGVGTIGPGETNIGIAGYTAPAGTSGGGMISAGGLAGFNGMLGLGDANYRMTMTTLATPAADLNTYAGRPVDPSWMNVISQFTRFTSIANG